MTRVASLTCVVCFSASRDRAVAHKRPSIFTTPDGNLPEKGDSATRFYETNRHANTRGRTDGSHALKIIMCPTLRLKKLSIPCHEKLREDVQVSRGRYYTTGRRNPQRSRLLPPFQVVQRLQFPRSALNPHALIPHCEGVRAYLKHHEVILIKFMIRACFMMPQMARQGGKAMQ